MWLQCGSNKEFKSDVFFSSQFHPDKLIVTPEPAPGIWGHINLDLREVRESLRPAESPPSFALQQKV